MTLSDPVKAIITQFVAAYPMPVGEVNLQNWTHKLCEQLAYSFPDDGWGHKASSAGAPHSKDCIALKAPFIGWDIIIGASGPTPTLDLRAESQDLSGQVFEPVMRTNWLSPQPPPPDDLEERVAVLEAQVRELRAVARQVGALWAGI